MLPWGTCDSKVPRSLFKLEDQSFGERDNAGIKAARYVWQGLTGTDWGVSRVESSRTQAEKLGWVFFGEKRDRPQHVTIRYKKMQKGHEFATFVTSSIMFYPKKHLLGLSPRFFSAA